MDGYFKVYRKILESQVFAHQTALKIWIWCLAKVTFKDRFVPLKSGRGTITVSLKPGQFIFGRFTAEEELNIDGSTVYKWMQKFASPEFDMITIESNNQYSIITLCNWEQYQNNEDEEVTTKEQPSNSGVTAEGQPSSSEGTQTRKIKKEEKEKNDIIDYSLILENYHLYCDKLPKVVKLSEERKKHIAARFKEFDLETIISVLKKTGNSEFLSGKNDRAWKADIDWIFNPTNFLKIMEGKYDNKIRSEQRLMMP